MRRRRVKITGIGPVTPAGIGRESFWKGIQEPVSRVAVLKQFYEGSGVFTGAEVRQLKMNNYDLSVPAKRIPRHTQLAIVGADLALKDAGLEFHDLRDRPGVVMIGAALMDFGVINKAVDVLDVAQQLLTGEILYREAKPDEAFAALREAVRREDALRYSEPPDWIIPVRHALGAALMQSGRHAEAEQVYRDDLNRHPENGWSLFGLARSLELQGKTDEASRVRTRFDKAWADADIKLSSSCFCQPGV